MPEPRVLNKYRDEIPDDAVYIGRPSQWGNPFRITPDWDRDEVVRAYEEWFRRSEHRVAAARRELKGKDLVCFCAPKTCHGDVLLRVANE